MTRQRRRVRPDRATTILFLAFAAVVAAFPLLGMFGVIAMTPDSIWALFAFAAAVAVFGLFAPQRLKHWVAEVIGRLPP